MAKHLHFDALCLDFIKLQIFFFPCDRKWLNLYCGWWWVMHDHHNCTFSWKPSFYLVINFLSETSTRNWYQYYCHDLLLGFLRSLFCNGMKEENIVSSIPLSTSFLSLCFPFIFFQPHAWNHYEIVMKDCNKY